MPRWAQPVCYQLPVQHGKVEEGCFKMMIPQGETLPAACPLFLWMSTSHGPAVLSLFFHHLISLSHKHIHTHSHFFSVPQIKEAADIIQKLHLIAQELPFDRWVRHPEGSFRQKQWHTRGTQSITFVPLSVIATLNLYSIMWFLKIVYFFILLVYRLKCHWYWFTVFLCQVCRCQGKNCK